MELIQCCGGFFWTPPTPPAYRPGPVYHSKTGFWESTTRGQPNCDECAETCVCVTMFYSLVYFSLRSKLTLFNTPSHKQKEGARASPPQLALYVLSNEPAAVSRHKAWQTMYMCMYLYGVQYISACLCAFVPTQRLSCLHCVTYHTQVS